MQPSPRDEVTGSIVVQTAQACVNGDRLPNLTFHSDAECWPGSKTVTNPVDPSMVSLEANDLKYRPNNAGVRTYCYILGPTGNRTVRITGDQRSEITILRNERSFLNSANMTTAL
jgi:hypothetical protein